MKETWILYRTTNNVNGRIYVGVHKVADTTKSRAYLGSGVALRPAIKMYGRENFTRATIAEFSCAENAYAAEAEIVTEEFINREDTYNIQFGGKGGITPTEETRKKIGAVHKGKILPEKEKVRLRTLFKGRSHTAETKAKIIAANTGGRRNAETKAKMSANSGRSLAVIIKGMYYPSVSGAARELETAITTVYSRIKSTNLNWSDWCFAKN